MFHFVGELRTPANITICDAEEEGEGNDVVGGCSLNKSRAALKAVGEGIERFALLPTPGLPLQSGSFRDLSDRGAIDPGLFAVGIKAATTDCTDLKLKWVVGRNLQTSATALLPAQFIYVPHIFADGEAVLRAPITTGAAASLDAESARLKGVLEAIERDAFMVAWLRQANLRKISLPVGSEGKTASDELNGLLRNFERYKLAAYAYLLPSDAPAHTIMAVLEDDSGCDPRMTFGTKSSPLKEAALIGALEEAFQMRSWMRELSEEPGMEPKDISAPQTLRERAHLWMKDASLQLFQTWTADAIGEVELGALPDLSNIRLGDLVSHLEDSTEKSCYSVDLTDALPSEVKSIGWQVHKVVCPGLQPLYLTEALADIDWRRLETLEQRTGVECRKAWQDPETYPHPFL